MRTWYEYIASKIHYLYRGIHNGIYVTYYQESNSFQYVLPLRYDNWCYSKHGRNKFFIERKDKRSLEEKIKDLILKRNDQIEISFWYSAATIMVWRRQHQQEVYKSLYILRQSSVVLTMKYYNVQRWNSTLSNKYFVVWNTCKWHLNFEYI